MKTSIHKLEERFLKDIVEIENDSFAFPWSETSYRSEITNPLADYAVIEADGAVIAYGGFRHVADEAQITNIAVRSGFRSMGYGKMLMCELIAHAKSKGIRAMTLEVRVSNAPAISLYTSLGFKNAGVRPSFYPDGEDAYIMWLEEL